MKPHAPIRVLQLGSPTGLYGAERWILALIRHLDPAKVHSITGVIKDAPDLAAPLIIQAAAMGFETMTIQARGKANFSAVTKLRKYILDNHIDILHTHWYKTDIIGFLATRGTPCKIVSTPHGWSRDAGIALQCYEMMDRMVFPLLDAVVTLSPELYDSLKKIPFLQKKLTLIHNGVDTTEIADCKTIAPELLEWKSQEVLIIGYIGQLIHRKGLDILFKAAAKLNSDIKWKIAMVGDGEQKVLLEQLASDLGIDQQVCFFGYRDNRLEFLNGFDVFALPSRLEGIPRCLMEAMACGIPVVSSDIPGSCALVKDGKTGLLFTPENDQELSQKINQLLNNMNERKTLSTNAITLIRNNHSAQKMALDYQCAYSELLFFDFNPL